MTSRSLQAVLRTLANAEPALSDGELLRQFIRNDEKAFGELVRRHGRLVWAVCRHLTGSDAEADDAFQATFLVLIRNAKTIRDAGRLSAWLYGVAYKVCAKARQASKRRAIREHAAATSERNGSVVADSAWGRALAAVHEEVAKLPETLRVPFVLCCLEGKGVTEAAEQLGWKLGTFSGRLTRAKDALLARLDARGLTLGVVASLGLATPPAAAVAKAEALAQVGFVIPGSVLQLTQGVIGMSMKSVKLLAVAMMLTCGLGLIAGTGWLATADAQGPKQPQSKVDPDTEVKRLQAELDRARQAAEAAKRADVARLEELRGRQLDARKIVEDVEDLIASGQKQKQEGFVAKTTKWEYDFVEVSDITQTKFMEFLQDRENRGWEFNGTTTMRHEGKPTAIWVFRRPAKGAAMSSQQLLEYYKKVVPAPVVPDVARFPKYDDAKAIEAEIARLQEKLQTLKSKPTWSRMEFAKNDLPLEPAEVVRILTKLAEKKFKSGRFACALSANGIAVEGDNEAIEWATSLIKKLSEK